MGQAFCASADASWVLLFCFGPFPKNSQSAEMSKVSDIFSTQPLGILRLFLAVPTDGGVIFNILANSESFDAPHASITRANFASKDFAESGMFCEAFCEVSVFTCDGINLNDAKQL